MLVLHNRSDNNWFSLRSAQGERWAEPSVMGNYEEVEGDMFGMASRGIQL